MPHGNLDTVRLLVGDTNADDPLLTDEEITHFIDANSVLTSTGGTASTNVQAAAADAASAIAAQYARTFDFSEDSQSFSRAQRVAHYLQIERDLRNRSGGYSVPIGGTAT